MKMGCDFFACVINSLIDTWILFQQHPSTNFKSHNSIIAFAYLSENFIGRQIYFDTNSIKIKSLYQSELWHNMKASY